MKPRLAAPDPSAGRPCAPGLRPHSGRRRRRELAYRAGTGGRRHPARSRLACALLRHALGWCAPTKSQPCSTTAVFANGRWKIQQASASSISPRVPPTFISRGLAMSVPIPSRSWRAWPYHGGKRPRHGCWPSSGERHWTCPPSLAEGSHHPDWFTASLRISGPAVTDGGTYLDDAMSCAEFIDLAQRSSIAGGVRLQSAVSAFS